MQKSICEQMGGTYTQVGDYLIHNLMLDEREQSPPWQIWADAKTYFERASAGVLYQSPDDRQTGSAPGRG